MSNNDGVGVDQDLFDYRSGDLLPLDDVERLGAGAQLGAKLGQVLSQTQIARPIGSCELERFQLGVDPLLLFA